MVRYLVEDAGITILAGEHPWVPTQLSSGRRPLGVISLPFALPGFVGRRQCWQLNLAAAGIILDAYDLEALAGRFRLTPGQIADAVAAARNHALWGAATQAPDQGSSRFSAQPTMSDLLTAARAQCGHDLATLAQKIEPVYTWEDIVLPGDALAQLREICQRVVHGHRVLSEWGSVASSRWAKGSMLSSLALQVPARLWRQEIEPRAKKRRRHSKISCGA